MPIDLVRDRHTNHLLKLDPGRFDCHTAVLAQSGAGKSFLVGRLIEELALKSKARVVILDPNSDFVRLGEPEPAVWADANLIPWFFPRETQTRFETVWSQVDIRVLSNRNLPNARPLRINWGGLTDAERTSIMNIDPRDRPDIYWCLVLTADIAQERWDDSEEADYDFEHFREVADEICSFLITGEGPDDIKENPLALSLRSLGIGLPLHFKALNYQLAEYQIWRSTGETNEDVSDVLTAKSRRPFVTVLDLLSLETESERIALTTRAVTSLWTAAKQAYGDALRDIDQPDTRSPIFLVIDEAHNIAPCSRSSPGAERLAGEIIRIAAEGRKFGLHLIIVTQRPRKVDANILSECDNLIIMRVTNAEDAAFCQQLFGFVSAAAARTANELSVGDLFLQGRVNGGDTVWHAAPRRTREGGRSLSKKHWTAPYRFNPTRGARKP